MVVRPATNSTWDGSTTSSRPMRQSADANANMGGGFLPSEKGRIAWPVRSVATWRKGKMRGHKLLRFFEGSIRQLWLQLPTPR
jgi:hypothetical protein